MVYPINEMKLIFTQLQSNHHLDSRQSNTCIFWPMYSNLS